jgi:hypothetical protein
LKTANEVWRTEWVHLLTFCSCDYGIKERKSISQTAWAIIFFKYERRWIPNYENLCKYFSIMLYGTWFEDRILNVKLLKCVIMGAGSYGQARKILFHIIIFLRRRRL